MSWLLLLLLSLPSPHHPHNLEHPQGSRSIPFSLRSVHSLLHGVPLLQTLCWTLIFMPGIENQHLDFSIQSISLVAPSVIFTIVMLHWFLHLSCSIHMTTSQTTFSLLSLLQLLNTRSPLVTTKFYTPK